MGQDQLEVLKENAEECLDLRMSKETPATVKDEVPVTQWEAEHKKEVSPAAVTARGGDLALEGWQKEGEGRWAELEVCWGERWRSAASYGWAPASQVGLPNENHVMCLISAG